MTKLNAQEQALLLAGVLADYALALVGGKGLNGSIPPVGLDDFSEAAKKLRYAAEKYNDHILSMLRDRSDQ